MKKIGLLWIVLAFSTAILWMFLQRPRTTTDATGPAGRESSSPAITAASAGAAKSEPAKTITATLASSDSTPDIAKPLLSYREEEAAIHQLAREFPRSKPTLLKIIAKEDVFRANHREVKEHSVDEITQNQLGAVKVMALRALMKQETDMELLKQDMDFVIQSSKDPTIVKIAQAARNSLDKGRSFFDDFVAGVDHLPL